MEKKAPPQYILDTCALLGYFNDEEHASTIQELLTQAQNRNITLLLPATQYGELLYLTEHAAGAEAAIEVKNIIFSLPLKVIPISISLTEQAAHFKARGGIAYADCFVLALAHQQKAIILTKDKEFLPFQDSAMIHWL